MKQSGRIHSQRVSTPRQSLIRSYDTESTVNFVRLQQLKEKYRGKEENRQNFSNNNFDIGGQLRGIMEREVKEFQDKIVLVDEGIQNRLNIIEGELERLKNIKNIQRQKENIQQQYLFQQKQNIKQSYVEVYQSKQNYNPILVPASIEQIQSVEYREEGVEESTCQLLGEGVQVRKFTEEYTSFINRLKEQIALDSDFTAILLSLCSKDRQIVKQILMTKYVNIDVDFFSVSSLELDPLQIQPVDLHPNIENAAQKLYQFYLQIQNNFNKKLKNKFSKQTLTTLWSEIKSQSPTIGHLTSYINMRTGKSFRNRSLVKLLRRIGLLNNQLIKSQFNSCFQRQ